MINNIELLHNKIKEKYVDCKRPNKKLREDLDMPRQTLYNKLNGKTDFTQKEILKISELYNLTPNEIVEIFLSNKILDNTVDLYNLYNEIEKSKQKIAINIINEVQAYFKYCIKNREFNVSNELELRLIEDMVNHNKNICKIIQDIGTDKQGVDNNE